MPQLVRLYIRHVAIGFLIGAAFVAMLLWFNVANLRHLIGTSDMGLVAVVMLVVANGIVFAGVQFGIAVMRMEDEDGGEGGGRRDAVPAAAPEALMVPVPVPATRQRARAPRR